MNPTSTEGVALITVFSLVKGLEHTVNGMLSWFLDVGIDPDEDEAFPGEDPASIAERLTPEHALTSHYPGWPAQGDISPINPDTPEGETLITICSDLHDLQHQISDLEGWLHMIVINHTEDPA